MPLVLVIKFFHLKCQLHFGYCVPQRRWHITRFSIYVELCRNEAVNFQFFMIFFAPSFVTSRLWFIPPQHIYTHHYLPLHPSVLSSSFILPPVYNWILFSGTYKCPCLLCLCLAPHFLSVHHCHPLLLSPPSFSFHLFMLCKATPLFLLFICFAQ